MNSNTISNEDQSVLAIIFSALQLFKANSDFKFIAVKFD
jgi:hypothetical protein